MSYFHLLWLLYNFIHSLRLSSDITSSEQPYLILPLWFRYPFQHCSVNQSSCPTICRPTDCSMPGLPVPHYLPEFAQTHVHWVNDAIQQSHPLLPTSPALNLSSIRVFSSEFALCIRWPKYWSFSFSISPSNEYSGLISFGIDWFDLLVIKGTLKCLLLHRSSKSSVLWYSVFFMVHLSHPYITIGKGMALTIQTFVGKVMSSLFNKLLGLS